MLAGTASVGAVTSAAGAAVTVTDDAGAVVEVGKRGVTP